ncbi:MAG TPA: hypothetical protein VFE50_16335 [Cyclobacteriaceae bacterium]|nr:hypothetical protein [Cyclobacteriaceae bacterium]
METSVSSKSFFSADKKLTFLLLLIVTYVVLYIKIVFIENETAAFEFLADRPEGTVLSALAALRFISVPIIYLWKFTVIGFVIWVGSFMWGYRVTFSQCWGVAIVSEFIFVVPELIKIFWYFVVDTDPSYPEIKAFYPLSLMNLYDYTEIDPRYGYPLRALNFFELVYWYLLTTGIHFFARKKKDIAMLIVLSSYVLMFFLWLWFYTVVYK